MARYWIVVGGPEVFARTREMGFVRHGFKSTRRLMAGKIQAGDRLGFTILEADMARASALAPAG